MIEPKEGVKYRVHQHGFRRIQGGMMDGVLMPSGWTVERFDEGKQIWIYLDCIHPTNGQKFLDLIANSQ